MITLIYKNFVFTVDMRKPYRASDDVFDVSNLVSTNPIKQFEAWFNELFQILVRPMPWPWQQPQSKLSESQDSFSQIETIY